MTKTAKAKLADRIRETSDRMFAEHVITPLMANGVYRSWRCGKPGTRTYEFTITTIPGHLIVTGDLQTLVVSREYDMLPWCRGAVDDADYFFSKISQNTFKIREGRDYNPQLYWLRDAVRWFVNNCKDAPIGDSSDTH